MRKRSAVIVFALLLLNTLPLLLFRDAAEVSSYSAPAIMLMIYALLNGIIACCAKHKGNFFLISRYNNPFTPDKAYTFTPEYDRSFALSRLIYFAAIPFYLPLIHFTKSRPQTLLALLVLAAPQMIFLILSIIEHAGERKADQLKKQQREQELREQMQREELGKWK